MSINRRRMMQYASQGMDDESNFFIATYNVESTDSETSILGADFDISQVSRMYVDGESVTPSTAYLFPTAGLHEVKFVMGSNFTSCYDMFAACIIEHLDFTNFDTSNVTDMQGMFFSCILNSEMDVSGFNTSNVTDMSLMFDYFAYSLEGINLEGFDTSNVTDMTLMFANSNLANVNLFVLDVSKVKSMYRMFKGSSTTICSISTWDVSNVEDMDDMFADCFSLQNLYLPDVVPTNCTYNGIFYDTNNMEFLPQAVLIHTHSTEEWQQALAGQYPSHFLWH